MHAVVDVDLEVGEGQLVGLIGPNGAGKTTFIDAISGFVRSAGRVELDGERPDPAAAARAGAARPRADVAVDRAVRRPLRRARTSSSRPPAVGLADDRGRRSRRAGRGTGEIGPALELLGLEAVADAMPSELSQGQRKLVGDRAGARREAAASSASTSRPPASTPTRARSSGGGCAASSTRGQAMLLVDHDMGLVLGICDEVVVLEFGKVIARGPADAVRRDERVIAAYLGSAGAELAPGSLDSAAQARVETVSEGDDA